MSNLLVEALQSDEFPGGHWIDFMNRIKQESLAGGIQPSQFDTVLPPGARQEMLKPKRPAILRRPVYQPLERPGIFKWVGGFALCAIILAGAIGHYSEGLKRPATPIAQPASTPILEPTPHTSWESYIAAHRAPRAELVRLPPPRAELVRAPEWQPGQARILFMPYDMEVRGVFKGTLSHERFLPQSGNAIGDTWVVGQTPWVWITTPGTTSPQWVDP